MFCNCFVLQSISVVFRFCNIIINVYLAMSTLVAAVGAVFEWSSGDERVLSGEADRNQEIQVFIISRFHWPFVPEPDC